MHYWIPIDIIQSLFKIDRKECSTNINEAEAPKFISSSNLLNLPNQMYLINTALFSNTET